MFDEIGHLSAPFAQVTRDGYLEDNVREFRRRLEHALAAWREWRQHLVPDYLVAFRAIGEAFTTLQDLSAALSITTSVSLDLPVGIEILLERRQREAEASFAIALDEATKAAADAQRKLGRRRSSARSPSK